MNERLISLQVLRGVAATLVVIGHGTLFRGTPVAAELFFLISGFIMMYVTQRGLDQYFTKRLIRLVPLYWIVNAAFALLLRPVTFTVPYFLKSIFFLTPVPFLAVGWTLDREVKFYILFWACAKLSLKHRGPIAILACLIWYGAAMARMYSGHIDPFPLMQPALILGILAYYCYGHLWTKELGRGRKVLLGAVILACALFLHSEYSDSLLWEPTLGTWSVRRVAVCGIPAFLIFLSVLLLVREGSHPAVRALSYVGNISYSLYLWHIVIQELIVKLLGKLGYHITTPSTFRFMLLNLSVSLAAASLSYKYLEQPISSYLRGRLLGRKK